jgi:phosphatidylglycerophosphatase A
MSEPQSDKLTLKESLGRADFINKIALILSSWFGTGLIPRMPGTVATLATIPVVIVMSRLGQLFGAIYLVILIFGAVWSSGVAERLMGRDDPSEVVIDEVAGFMLTMYLLPLSWLSLALGFIMFRFFDILKPFPIKRLERIGGGKGIVLDDLVAGVYAGLSINVLLFFCNCLTY